MAGSLAAQHELTGTTYTKTDIGIGNQFYIANCIYCHGPDGDQIAGVDFAHAKFPRSRTDDDIVKILRNGITGTGMPAQTMPEPQLRTIVAYLRSLPAAAGQVLPAGADASRGKTLFAGKGQCINCHHAQGVGSHFGPDLSDIGMLRRVADLDQALSDPNAVIMPGVPDVPRAFNQRNYAHRPHSQSGHVYLQLIDNKERLLSYQRSDLKEFSPIDRSPMPAYKDSLSAAERADLVAYLMSLKGIPRP